jgi:hypothetical protein
MKLSVRRVLDSLADIKRTYYVKEKSVIGQIVRAFSSRIKHQLWPESSGCSVSSSAAELIQ